MSEYTPDKNLIKECYIEAMSLETDSPDHAAEFDRWLAQHDAEVAKATEERIIKLLEQQEVEGWFDTGFKKHLIALIKGKINEQ